MEPQFVGFRQAKSYVVVLPRISPHQRPHRLGGVGKRVALHGGRRLLLGAALLLLLLLLGVAAALALAAPFPLAPAAALLLLTAACLKKSIKSIAHTA
jgi:hypothetical protein